MNLGIAIPDAMLKGYLAEGSRINIALYGRNFTQALTWVPTSGNVTAAINAVGIDGAIAANTLTKVGGSDESFNQTIAISNATTYTASFFIKKDAITSRFPEFYITDSGVVNNYVQVNTSTGAISARIENGTVSSAIASANSTYWRLQLIMLSGTTTAVIGCRPAAGTTLGVFNAAATGSVVVDAAMLELGSFASTYIPTVASAVTRAGDVLTYPTASNILGTTGTAYAEINTSTANTVLSMRASGAGGIPLTASGANVAIFDGTGYKVSTTVFPLAATSKVATSWSGTVGAASALGVITATPALDGDINVTTNIGVGVWADGTAGTPLFGTIRNVRIWPNALLDSALQVITSPGFSFNDASGIFFFRSMLMADPTHVAFILDTGQARSFNGATAMDLADGSVIYSVDPVGQIGPGGLGRNTNGAVCVSNLPPEVYHQGVPLRNDGRLCISGIVVP